MSRRAQHIMHICENAGHETTFPGSVTQDTIKRFSSSQNPFPECLSALYLIFPYSKILEELTFCHNVNRVTLLYSCDPSVFHRHPSGPTCHGCCTQNGPWWPHFGHHPHPACSLVGTPPSVGLVSRTLQSLPPWVNILVAVRL